MSFDVNNFCLGGSFVEDILEIILCHQDLGVRGHSVGVRSSIKKWRRKEAASEISPILHSLKHSPTCIRDLLCARHSFS